MTTVIFDTLELVNELKQNGFTPEQSEAIISVLKKAQHELTTKRDLEALEYRLTIKIGIMLAASIGLLAAIIRLT